MENEIVLAVGVVSAILTEILKLALFQKRSRMFKVLLTYFICIAVSFYYTITSGNNQDLPTLIIGSIMLSYTCYKAVIGGIEEKLLPTPQ